MKRYLVNAASLNMIGGKNARWEIRWISIEAARSLARDAQNALGHASTAAVVGAALYGAPLPAQRIDIQLEAGDELLVAQYQGPRLAEGTTILPAGAQIAWALVVVE